MQASVLMRFGEQGGESCIKTEVLIPSDESTAIQIGCELQLERLKFHFSAMNFHRTILPFQDTIHRTRLKITIF